MAQSLLCATLTHMQKRTPPNAGPAKSPPGGLADALNTHQRVLVALAVVSGAVSFKRFHTTLQ